VCCSVADAHACFCAYVCVCICVYIYIHVHFLCVVSTLEQVFWALVHVQTYTLEEEMLFIGIQMEDQV